MAHLLRLKVTSWLWCKKEQGECKANNPGEKRREVLIKARETQLNSGMLEASWNLAGL